VAVLTTITGDRLHMRAALFSPDGSERIDAETQFAPGDGEGPVRLAALLLACAPAVIRVHFAGSRGNPA
jgi:hydroxymethylbilane synthase